MEGISEHEAPAYAKAKNHRIAVPDDSNVGLRHRFTLGDYVHGLYSTKFDPSDTFIAAGYGDGFVRVFNNETGKMSFEFSAHAYAHGNIDEMPVTSMRWRPQVTYSKTLHVLVTGQADGSIRHWHVTTGKCIHHKNDTPENQIFTIDYNRDGTMLAAAGKDGIIRVYDEQTK